MRAIELTKAISNFWARLDKTTGHWIFTGKARSGSLNYGSVTTPTTLGLGRRVVGAHRFAFFLTHGYWPENARHTCDIPLCCNPDHIVEGTQADNVQDCVKRHRRRNGNIKLNPEIWAEIRKSTESSTVLGKRYGVTSANIRSIRSGKSGWVYNPKENTNV
jgi:hypothetical protein